jgi:hypothetical protein
LPVFRLDSTSARPAGDGRLWGDGFEIETLLNLRVARAGLKVAEVPSYEHRRIHGESNLNAIKDGLRVLRTIAREYVKRRSPVAAITHRPWTGNHPVGIHKRPPIESVRPVSTQPAPAPSTPPMSTPPMSTPPMSTPPMSTPEWAGPGRPTPARWGKRVSS